MTISMFGRNALAVGIIFTLWSVPAKAQVFVRTVLDQAAEIPPRETSVKAFAEDLHLRGYETKDMEIGDLTAPEWEKLSRIVLKKLEDDLEKLSRDKTKSKEDFDKEALALCKKTGWALKNRPHPVGWSSARSVCFWLQPSLDFAHAAQIVGGDNQGTASIEAVSDIFWGLRVRIQTSVTGTDSAEPDAQAQALLKQLQTSGGSFSVGATYPWYALVKSNERVRGLLTSFLRVGGAIPALGSGSHSTTIKATDANGSVELALVDSSLEFQSFRNSINFVVTGRGSVVNGTRKFNESIKNTGHRGFAYGQIGAGLRFSDSVWLLASRSFYSHKLPGSGMTYSVLFGK
jgi:hypothetical protein